MTKKFTMLTQNHSGNVYTMVDKPHFQTDVMSQCPETSQM